MAAKKGFSTVLIVALALVVLFLTNPKPADFKAYLSSRASGQVEGKDSGGIIGTLSRGAAAVAGGAASLASAAYKRGDYFIFSTYATGDKGGIYLGFAKRVFIKLR